MLAIVTQCASEKRDVARQPGVLDEAIGPHGLEEMFLADDFSSALYEHEQDLEHLRSQLDDEAVSGEQGAVGRELEPVEHVAGVSRSRRSHREFRGRSEAYCKSFGRTCCGVFPIFRPTEG